MAAPLTDSRPVASPVQYSAHQDLPATEVPRTDSFVGLPPIRRTSTFGPLGDKNGQSDDGESADADSYRAGVQDVIPPVPAIPSGMVQSAKGQHDSAQYSQVSHQQSQGPAAQYNPHEGHVVNGQKGYHLPNGAYPPAPGRNGAPVQFPGIPVSQFSQYNMNMQGRNGFPSPTGLPGIQTGMQSSSAQPAVRPGAASPPSAGGNPIHRFPPQGQWKLEESQLSEPLNTSRKTQTPPAQQTGYYAGDKETESLVPVGGPSQLPQRNPRNNSQPPVAAQRFPGLFPAGSSNQSPVHQDHIQVAPAAQQAQQHRRDSMGVSRSPTRDLEDDNKRQQSLLTQIGGKLMPTRARPDSISKDGFQADEVSVSETSIITEDEPERKHKRASFFGMGNSGNTGAQSQPGHVDIAPQQFQSSGPGEKKKTFFGASGLAKQMTSMGGGKTENASGGNDTNSNPGSGAKKRLSEFRSIFKSGPKDDAQPNKTERPTSGRPSMQSSIRPSTEDQGFHSSQTQPNAQLGMMAPPPINRGRSSTQGSVQGTPMGLPPNMGQLRPQHTGDGPEKRAPNGALASAGGFLGNLLGNKPGSSAKDPTNPQISQMGQPGYGPASMGGQQPQRGQFAPSSYQHPQQMGPHGQPNYPPGQLQALNNRMRQMSNPGVPQQHLSPGQPSGPHQQTLQDQTRALNHDARGALDPNRITPTGEHQRILAAPANDDSPRSSQEFLRVNRKPVGSGSSRLASGSIITPPAATSSQPPSKSEIEPSRTPEPSNEFGGDGQRPSEIYQSHQSSHLGASTQAGHIRQPSLPTPSQSPAPPPGSPGANRISAQSGQSSLSPYVQQQGFNDAAQIGQPKTVSGTNGGSMPFQPFPGQQAPGMQGPPGQAGPGQQPPLQGPGRLSPQPTQPWGFTRTATQPPMGPASSGQHQQMYPGQASGAAGSVQEQKGPMSKLFGAGRKRNSTSPQPPIGGFPMQTKEKESTSSKLLGAFKRSSKQQDSSKMQQPVLPQAQRTSGRAEAPDQPIQPAQPVQPVQLVQPVQANQIGQPGQQPGQPGQSSQAMPLYMTPAGRGQSPAPGPMPQGSLGASGQPPRASPGFAQPAQFNRGQASPPMPGDRGQLPSQTTRVGHGQISPAVLPMMQSTRSQAQAPRPEPQYAAVPIPRGYEAVHGYGVPNMLAHSPYFVGRGSPPQHFGTQFQPLMPQYSGASQQFQPVMPQHTGSSQHVQQMVPQPTDNNPADPQRPSPTPSQQTQSAPGHPQNQIPPHSGVAANSEQGNQLLRVDDHAPPQQFITRQGGSPDSHQQVPAAQESSARNSPQPAPGGDAFLSPPSHENLQQRPSAQDQIVAPATRNDDAQAPRTQPQQILTSMGQLEMPRNASPQNQPLPDSATTFSPVNAATGRLSDPPLPPVTSIYNGDQQSVHNASHTPSPPMGTQNAGRFGLHHMTSSQSVAEDARHQSYGRDVDPHRHFNVSPEPPRSFSVPAQQLSNPNLIVNVNKANSHSSDRDDMYDATPRNSHPSQLQQVPMQESVLQHPEEPARHDGYGAAMAGGAVAGVFAGDVTSSTISRTSSIQAEPSQLVAPAQAAPMEPEEKILVDQPVELAAVNDDDDGMPMMSATSYPGQEWNPYGAGEFGDFD